MPTKIRPQEVLFAIIVLSTLSGIWICSVTAVDWKSYTHPEKDVRFQHAVEDDSNGDIYFLDNWNKIHRFTSDLKPVQVGSSMKSQVESAATEQIFLMQSNTTRMLACSVGSCGLFWKERKAEKWHWSALNQTIPANIFSRKGVSTLATTYTDGNSTFFYVASEAINATIPVFSLRQIDQSSQPPNFELTKLSPRHTADIFGSLTVDESRLTNHSIKPIFLQILARKNPDSRHNYGYLITVQLDDDGIFHTRLGRFCAGDPTLRSYTEVTIDCEHVWRHRIATAAALQEDTVNGDFLAVTFGKDSHSSNGQIEQALCIYSMAEIDAHFDEEIQHCYKDGSRKLLGWIKEEKKDCLPPTDSSKKLSSTPQFKEEHCKNSWKPKMNGFISGQDTLTKKAAESFNTALPGLQFANLPFFPKKDLTSYPILLVSLVNGTIFIKDQYLKQFDDVYTPRILLNSNLIWISSNSTPKAFMLANGSKYAIINENQIFSFPVGCGMHTECAACHENSDRLLDCGWCSGFCRTSTECTAKQGTWSNDACPPEIFDFSPKNGSVAGNTPISISGNHFGQSDANVTVRIGQISCNVTAHNYTSIQCITEPGSGEQGREVEVNVWSAPKVTAKYRCKGQNRTVDHQFRYLAPHVKSFSPTFGPSWGGTLVTLEGNHLDTGVKRQILIGDNRKPKYCLIISQNCTHLRCKMPKFDIETVASKIGLEFLVDDRTTPNITTKFKYLDNPTFNKQLDPTKSIFSGGTGVYFQGSNLDSIAPQPARLSVNLAGHVISTVCHVENNQMLFCPAPPIASLVNDTSTPITVNATLNLEQYDITEYQCPNANRSLVYYPDPKFTNISIEKEVLPQSWVAVIKGSNLAEDLTELTVSIGGHLCNESVVIDNGTIRCTVQFIQEFPQETNPVMIKYGYLKIDLPLINFPYNSPEPTFSSSTTSQSVTVKPSGSTGLIVGIVIGVLAATVLMTFICLHRKKLWMRQMFHTRPTASLNCTLHFNPNEERYPVRLIDECKILPSDTLQTNCLPTVEFFGDQRPVLNPYYWVDSLQCGPLSPPFSPINSKIEKIVRSLKLEKNVVQPRRLELDEKIGEGHFGSVYKGSFYTTDDVNSNQDKITVAVKCLRENHLFSTESVKKFLEECAVMVNLSHDNVMRLEGICFDQDENGNLDPRLILPFLANGDLSKYVRNQPPLAIYTVLDLSIQIAKGMRYLSTEAYSQRVVHRDLAARNCMLDENMKVVIADFGLSRNVQQSDDGMYVPTNVQNVPFRWLAPECLVNNQYSTKSDVWSFGVVIWELFERGRLPYDPTFNPEKLMNFLLDGRRLEKPVNSSSELYSLMLRCWDNDPTARPDFEELVFQLVNMRKSYPIEIDGYVTHCGILKRLTHHNK